MKNLFLLLFSLCLLVSSKAQTVLQSWDTKGNLGLNSTLHFLGTGDNVDLVFRTNNIERANLSNNGLFFIQKNATAVNAIQQPNISASCGIHVAYSPQAGAINLLPFQEKGRYFYIVNYSGANLSLSHSVQVGINANSNIIGNGARWMIIWDGVKFIRVL